MDLKKIFDRYKLQIEEDQIFDPIREKYVHLTPEEIVRQKTIKFLINRLKVPKERIIVERGLNTLGVKGSSRRIDIGVFDDEEILIAVIECKKKLTSGGEAAFIQAQNYLRALNTRYFFITDGVTFSGWYYDTIRNIALKDIPSYDKWYEYPIED